MNEKKIAFILCVNDDSWLQECELYIQQLKKPEDFTIEILAVKDAVSMTAGYNEGMRASDAKYKVYLHQDVFIVNRNFIFDILSLFQDRTIGMVGMVGVPQMPKSGVMWHSLRYGNLHDLPMLKRKFDISPIAEVKEEYLEVEATDGLLMATQYDILWREDIFDKWDFYDVSQSFEFRKQGYRVVVPRQEAAWCIHECGKVSLWNYGTEKDKFLKEYASMLEERA